MSIHEARKDGNVPKVKVDSRTSMSLHGKNSIALDHDGPLVDRWAFDRKDPSSRERPGFVLLRRRHRSRDWAVQLIGVVFMLFLEKLLFAPRKAVRPFVTFHAAIRLPSLDGSLIAPTPQAASIP